MSSANPSSSSSSSLTAEEKKYFGGLFKQADTEQLGVLTGEHAVKFFEKSGLPPSVLGQIWELSDTENTGFLTPQSFSVALRLIGQCQNGRSPEASLARQPGPLPRFDGVELPRTSAGPPPPKSRSVVPTLTPEERARYFGTWQAISPNDELLEGERARDVFGKANLSNEQLGGIWNLADTRRRGALDSTEFIIAMHLIQSTMNGSMKAIPQALPSGLFEAAAKGPTSARQARQQPSTSSFASQDSVNSQYASPRAAVPVRSQLTGPPGRGSPQLQQQQQQQQQSQLLSPTAQQAARHAPTASVVLGEWDVKPHEKANYDNLFSDIDKGDAGTISGDQAVTFFLQSKLPEDELALVWDLSDVENTGTLNRDTFAVAMHLIKGRLGGSELPRMLPASLIPPSMRAKVQVPTAAAVAEAQQQPQQQPSSAAADLFGLNDDFAAPVPSKSPPAAAFTDNFGNSAPRAFVPTSSFGQVLQQQHRPAPPVPLAVPVPAPAPTTRAPHIERDLLDDAEPTESRSLSNDTTELANLSNQISSLSAQSNTVKKERVDTQADLERLRTQKTEVSNRLAQIRQLYDEEVKTVRTLQQEQVKLRAENKELSNEASLLEASLGAVKQQHEQLDAQLQKDRAENVAIKQKIKAANDETTALKATLEKLQKEAKQQRGLVAINTKQLNTIEADRTKVNKSIEDERLLAAEQERNRAIEEERARANEEQKRSAIISPALSTASTSTNPFHRGGNVDRKVSSPFSPSAAPSSGPAFPFSRAAAAGGAAAGVGVAAAAALGVHELTQTRAPTGPFATASISNPSEVPAARSAEEALPPVLADQTNDQAVAAPIDAASTSAPTKIVSPKPIPPQVWSNADPSEKDARIASPGVAKPMPAAVNNLVISSGMSDNGSVNTSVQVEPSESGRNTTVYDSRPLTPASMSISTPADSIPPSSSDRQIMGTTTTSAPFQSATNEEELEKPVAAKDVQQILSSPPHDSDRAIPPPFDASTPQRVTSPGLPVPGAIPTKAVAVGGAAVAAGAGAVGLAASQHTSSAKGKEVVEPASISGDQPRETIPDELEGSATPKPQQPSVKTVEEPVSDTVEEATGARPAETIELDSSDDEDDGPEQPRGMNFFGGGTASTTAPSSSAIGETTSIRGSVEPVPTPVIAPNAALSQPVEPTAVATKAVAEVPEAVTAPTTTSSFVTAVSGPIAASASAADKDEFDEFDDLEEADEGDEEDDELNQSYVTSDFDQPFDAPSPQHNSARKLNNPFPPSSSGSNGLTTSGSTILQTPQQPFASNVAQDSPARDFSEYAHYSSMLSSGGAAAGAGSGSSQAPPASMGFGGIDFAAPSTSTQNPDATRSPPPPAPSHRHGQGLTSPPPSKPPISRAPPSSMADDPMLTELMDMGFDRQQSVDALERFNYDLGRATDFLLSGGR